jgi:hypothetical protein
MARPMGSGPIHVFVGFGPPATQPNSPAAVTAATALYYGTTRSGPDITERLDFYEVMNDITGPKQSLDSGFAGREDDINLIMSSWDQTVDNRFEHFLDPGDFFNARGTDALSDLGTLMLSEGRTVGLWLVKGAASKAINIGSGMPLGRYYPTCIIGSCKLVEGNKENLRVRSFTAKKNIYQINSNQLPLFREDNAAFNGLFTGPGGSLRATFG